MKNVLLSLFATLAVSPSLANATSLAGHVLSCRVDLSQTVGGIQTTTYKFIRGVRDENLALIFVEESGTTRVSPYFVQGGKLVIEADAGHVLPKTPIYDLSNPSRIRREYESCIYPGQGGGDSHPVCADVVEECVLH